MLSNVLGAIFSTLVVATAAMGIGAWLWRGLPATFSKFDRLACSWLGGLGLLGLSLFLVGQFAFTRTTIFLTLGAAAAAAISPLARTGKARIALFIRDIQITALPAIIIAIVLIVTVLGGFSEIVGDWGHDAIAYHLLGPKVWLRNGIVRPVPDNCHTAFPAMAEYCMVRMALAARALRAFLQF